jgi:DNA-binding transcriptional regulator of glucitol operon
MSSKWFSGRALRIHVLSLLWIALCAGAAWWQISRAVGGNALSWVYAIEWPVFAGAGIYVWWHLLNTAPVTAQEREERRVLEEELRAQAQASKRRPDDEDDALRAYNDHLATLADNDRSQKEQP